jgi:hypothetical protein
MKEIYVVVVVVVVVVRIELVGDDDDDESSSFKNFSFIHQPTNYENSFLISVLYWNVTAVCNY